MLVGPGALVFKLLWLPRFEPVRNLRSPYVERVERCSGEDWEAEVLGAEEVGTDRLEESVDIEFNEVSEAAGDTDLRRESPEGVPLSKGDWAPVVDTSIGPCRGWTGGVRGGTYSVAFLSSSLSMASGRSSILGQCQVSGSL